MSPALAGKKDYCTNVSLVIVYRLSADPTSTLGLCLGTRQVCSVEFEAFKLQEKSFPWTLLAQFKLIANNESTNSFTSRSCVSGI